MSDEPRCNTSSTEPDQTRAQVIRITAPDPFASGNTVRVEVDKPDTMSTAQLSLKSTVPMTMTNPPGAHQIAAGDINANKPFDVLFQGGTSGHTQVTFTATVKQAGHADHSLDKTVQLS